MSTEFKQPVSVLVVIHTHRREFLLIERARHPGFWQSVTGSRDGAEALWDTARREVWEETGINPFAGIWRDWHEHTEYVIRPEWRHRYAPNTTTNTEHFYSLCVPSVTSINVHLNPQEHRDFGWFSGNVAAQQCFSPSNSELIKRLCA